MEFKSYESALSNFISKMGLDASQVQCEPKYLAVYFADLFYDGLALFVPNVLRSLTKEKKG